MKKLFVFSLIILSSFAQAQTADSGKVIGIHPAVGKLITRDEKIRYRLFSEYKDSTFENAKIIKYNDSTFVLDVTSIQGTEIKTNVNTKQLDDLYFKIDDVVKGKSVDNDEYVKTDQEKKEERKRRRADADRSFWYNFFAEMTILTFETILTFAFTN